MITDQNGNQMPESLTLQGVFGSREFHQARLSPQDLAAHGWRRLVVEEGCAPLGYAPIEAQEVEGEPIWYAARNGTIVEIAEECLQLKRERLEAKRTDCLRVLDAFGYGPQMLVWRNDPARTLTELAWFDEPIWRRLDPRVIEIGALWGIDDEQLDGLFEAAVGSNV